MRLAKIAVALIGMTLMVGISAYASPNIFYPPERIDCRLDSMQHVRCEGFDHQILGEFSSNADFHKGMEYTFYFVTGRALFTSDKRNAIVYFNYNNAKGELVRLKTKTMAFHPDITHGRWKKDVENVYSCDESYMVCSITDKVQR